MKSINKAERTLNRKVTDKQLHIQKHQLFHITTDMLHYTVFKVGQVQKTLNQKYIKLEKEWYVQNSNCQIYSKSCDSQEITILLKCNSIKTQTSLPSALSVPMTATLINLHQMINVNKFYKRSMKLCHS